MITWSMTSRDPERSRSWPPYVWGFLSRKRLERETRLLRSTCGKCIWAIKWSRVRWRHVTLLPARRTTSGLAEVAQYERFFYTVSHKTCGTHFMRHNSRKCGPIFVIISLSHSQINCRERLNKTYHLTLNLLPHYRAKVECSTLLLYSTSFNANVMQNCLFTVSFYQRR